MLLVQVGRFNFADFMGQKLRERKIKKYTNRVVYFSLFFFSDPSTHTLQTPTSTSTTSKNTCFLTPSNNLTLVNVRFTKF